MAYYTMFVVNIGQFFFSDLTAVSFCFVVPAQQETKVFFQSLLMQ